MDIETDNIIANYNVADIYKKGKVHHWSNVQSACPWSGRPEFSPWLSHTKDSKNGT